MSRPLRVLIVAHAHPQLSRGGAEIASHLLFEELRRGSQVDAWFLAASDEPERQRPAAPISPFDGEPRELLFATDTVERFLFSQRSGGAIGHFTRLLNEIAPDIVHFHHYTGLGLELIAAVRRANPGIRIVLTLHEFMAMCHNYGQMVKTGGFALCSAAGPQQCAACFPAVAPDRFFLRELFVKAHLDKVDLFVSPSEFLRRRYVAWGLPAEKIAVVENGLPPVAPAPPRPLMAGERRGVFGFFGQLHPYKGLPVLLAAFEAIQRLPGEAAASIRLIVNGAYLELNAPQYIDHVKQLLARTAQRVRFAGPYDSRDLPRLMGEVDWVVVPSLWWENAPVVIEEALAHRRPVLCGDIGGMAEKVRPGRDGFHVPVGRPADLAALIVRVASDPAIWDGVRQTMRPPASLPKMAARHLELYRGVSAGSR